MKDKIKKNLEISKKMTFSEILEICPKAFLVLEEEGMGCMGCLMSNHETLEEGAKGHGINPDKLVEKINKLL